MKIDTLQNPNWVVDVLNGKTLPETEIGKACAVKSIEAAQHCHVFRNQMEEFAKALHQIKQDMATTRDNLAQAEGRLQAFAELLDEQAPEGAEQALKEKQQSKA